MNLIQSFRAARRCGVPLVILRTADPAGTMAKIITEATAKTQDVPLVKWDIVNGAIGVNDCGSSALAAMLKASNMDASSTTNPTEFLGAAKKLDPKTRDGATAIIFMMFLHRFIDDSGLVQAMWNLRDIFKGNGRMLIGVCPTISLPIELSQDVLVLDEPLPSDKELATIAEDIFNSAQLPVPDAAAMERIVDATLGLAAFPAEQSMAMCIGKKGMNIQDLWARKQATIEQTPGLSIWRGGETFADIGGCENIKGFLRAVIKGKDAPRAIVFLDEIEKAIGTGQDTSGVSQGMLGLLLTWMQDNLATGCILIGPPGAAKSAISKAAGNEAGIPTIAMDMGGAKNSLVGASESRMRDMLQVIDAVSQKRSLWLATCNSISILPPELRRRFTFGTFFFPLPDATDRAKIWGIFMKKFGIPDQPLPDDEGWTGAEIRQCCDIAYRIDQPLVEAAGYIVPVSVAASGKIDALCREADNRYISAAYPGLYRYEKLDKPQVDTSRSRALRLE